MFPPFEMDYTPPHVHLIAPESQRWLKLNILTDQSPETMERDKGKPKWQFAMLSDATWRQSRSDLTQLSKNGLFCSAACNG